MTHTVAVLPGINAIRCPVCSEAAKRQRKYSGPINTVFVNLSFDEQALVNLGDAIVKSGICQGEAPFGQHEVEFKLRSVGRLPGLTEPEPEDND